MIQHNKLDIQIIVLRYKNELEMAFLSNDLVSIERLKILIRSAEKMLAKFDK